MEAGSGRDRDAAANKQQRAGKHVQQPAGHQAFRGCSERPAERATLRGDGLFTGLQSLERRFQNPEGAMKCVICKTGETRAGTATVPLHRGDTTVLVKDTPAEVCQNCGEYYLDETVARNLYARAEEAARRHAEVEILRYAA
jgi:YgiT-type zinc finger domain-containing protein